MRESLHVADDLRGAALFLSESLNSALDLGEDWAVTAGATDWSCRDTLDHIANVLCSYAGSLANRSISRRRHQLRHGDPAASPTDLLGIISEFAGILAVAAEAAADTHRAFHPAGMADREGFVAMGCDEILIHGQDIATSLSLDYTPPSDLAARVLARLFPWAPGDADPWQALLWANGRISFGGHERLDARWWWHCAPLDEWSGEVRRRA